jgi:hypothetical protein
MSGGISEVFSTINQGRRYIEANGFGEKGKNKYAKNIVEERRDNKTLMNKFEDTTGNNHHHQN